MPKLGIFRLEDYCPDAAGMFARLRWRLTRHRISLQLLRTAIPASPREIQVFEAIMQVLRLNSGVYRTTFHNRFHNLDPLVNELLVKRFGPDAALEIHDWAASDCLTSSEWAASLLPLFPNAVLKASDLTLYAVEVNYGKCTVIQERDGQLLQYVSPSVVLNLTRPEQRPRLLARIMQKKVQSMLAEMKAKPAITAEWLNSDSEAMPQPPFTVRKLPMVHPEAALFRARNARFSIARHSAFDALPKPVDVIRSMNIYNLSYFDPPRLREGAEAVRQSLKPGGIWIVGRTWQEAPPSHNVSVFEKTDAGFRLVCRYGEGSEIESIVLEGQL